MKIKKSKQTQRPSAMGSDGSEGGHFAADGAERGQLQLGGVLVVVVVAGGGGGLVRALVAAAAAALQEGPAEGLAQAEEDDRGDAGLEEQQELADDVQKVHGLPGDPGGHVGGHDVVDVLGNDAEPVQDGQGHHRAVHLALQLDLPLVPAGAGFLRLADFPRRHQGAGDGEQRGQTEVTAEIPPEPGAVVGEGQDVDGVRQVRGDLDDAALRGGAATEARVLLAQLAKDDFGKRQQESAHPYDSQLGGCGGAVFYHLIVHLHVGGSPEAVYAQGT